MSDNSHPSIQSKARELTAGGTSLLDKTCNIFNFVRDEIRFGFPSKWDSVRASETLFLALCKAAGIPARIHTGLIDINITRGIMPSFAFPFPPDTGGHTWMEIKFNGEWKPIDSYINDKPFSDKALKRLQESGDKTGFSISQAKGPSSCEFNFGKLGFMHMGAVLGDHGP